MQAVRKFNEEHTNIFAHRQHQFADGLNGGMLTVGHPVELSHPIHQVGDFLPKFCGELFHGVVGVFYRVMKQPGRQHGAGCTHLRQDRCHSNRVGNVRVATFTFLPAVVPIGHLKGTLKNLYVFLRMVFAQGTHHRGDHGREMCL